MGFGSKLRHKVGIRPPKEMTYEENQQVLDDLGIMRKKNPEENRHKEKFSAYGAMAKDLANKKDQELVPEGYEEYSAQGTNPYVYNRHSAKPDDYNGNPYSNKHSDTNDASAYNPYRNNVVKKDQYSQVDQNDGANTFNSQNNNGNVNPYATESNGFESNENSTYSSNNNPYSSENNNYNRSSNQQSATDNNPYSSNNNRYNNNSNTNGNGNNLYSSNSLNNQPNNQKPGTASPYTSARINPYKKTREPRNTDVNQNNEDTFDFEEGSVGNGIQRAPTNTTDFNSAPNSNSVSAMNKNFSSIPEYNEDGDDDFNASINENEQIGGYGEDQAQLYPSQQPVYADDQYEDFNTEPEIQETNYTTFEDMQRQQQEQEQREQDEEVDTIKQQIRFTKQSSAASTRNTLKMARDAEMAGLNTLGMLGSQSEKLGNIESNLTLMKIQHREADDRVSELKKLNRSVFAVHVSNPFTSKRRARELEEKIKNQREMDKEMQNDARQKLYDSTNSVSHAMNSVNDGRLGRKPQQGADSLKEKYSRNEILTRNKKYVFEGDEEDEDLEVEIDRNLDEIGAISKRLKNIATSQSAEVNKQQNRLNDIEEDTDNLDIKLYWNTKRLQNIK
ncbi:hypothetical protein ACO0SA_003994 [Hanseniaspora valbyensis]